jgi:O-antigen/teichoic acid export membrane protein
LVVITIASNLILIPKYGIDGAAMATAISVLLFNLIRLILIKVKMNMHPFSFNSFKTILVLFVIYYLLQPLPKSSILLLDIFWRSSITIILYIPLVLWLKLSEDITKFTKDLRNKLFL